jgi:mannose-6-phosphate isomerase-like protein (cupin superfamily)
MEKPEFFKNYKAFIAFRAEKYGKSTLFENEHILVGLNCLQPGQEMVKHAHEVQCRFYFLLEGHGRVWIGEEEQETEAGMVIWVPPEHTHRILNTGIEPLILLVGIAPTQAE